MENGITLGDYVDALRDRFCLDRIDDWTLEGETGDIPVRVNLHSPGLTIEISINRSRLPIELSEIPKLAQPFIASGALGFTADKFHYDIIAIDLSSTTPEEFEAIARNSVDWLRDNGYLEPGNCSKCGQSINLAMEYFRNRRICYDCVQRCQETRQKVVEELNQPKPAIAALIPGIVILASIGWLGIWLGYEYLAFKSGSRTIRLPAIVVLLLLGGIGSGIGAPLGKLVRRTGLLEKFSVERTLFVLVAVSVLIGETLFAGIVLVKNEVTPSFASIWAVWNSYGLMYAFSKLIAAGAIYFGAQFASDPKKLPAPSQ